MPTSSLQKNIIIISLLLVSGSLIVLIGFSAGKESFAGNLHNFFFIGFCIAQTLIVAGFICYLLKQRAVTQMQKDFVNNLSHEFRTPLSVIKIAGEVLQSDNIHLHPEKIKKYSSVIGQQMALLQMKMDRLLKISSIDEHRLQPSLVLFSFAGIVHQAQELLQPLILEKKAEIVVHPEPGVPMVKGDPGLLKMMMVDLLENALHHAGNPKIVVSIYRRKNNLAISIKDNGPGISRKHRKQVFEKFYRIPTGNVHNVKGMGLGLYFVHQTLLAHKGKIELHSNGRIGSEFIAYLPL